MNAPALVTKIDGKNKTLYMSTVKQIEEVTKGNLKKTLKELGLLNGQNISVADATSPKTISFKLTLATNME